MASIASFADVLDSISGISPLGWVFLAKGEVWSLRTKAAVLEMDDVPPEMEDSPDAGIPDFAKENGLMPAITVSDLQDVVENIKEQFPGANTGDYLRAFLFYYDNDAFMKL